MSQLTRDYWFIRLVNNDYHLAPPFCHATPLVTGKRNRAQRLPIYIRSSHASCRKTGGPWVQTLFVTRLGTDVVDAPWALAFCDVTCYDGCHFCATPQCQIIVSEPVFLLDLVLVSSIKGGSRDLHSINGLYVLAILDFYSSNFLCNTTLSMQNQYSGNS